MPSTIAIRAASAPISVRGARVHNLRNIDLEIPANSLVVITGVSGSGKSSLAFDTLYAEGQRRYVESLSAYARQFLERMDKPDVDDVQGVSPAISIQQRVPPRTSRSTVGTVTEIQDYLRLLYARAGTTVCPSCGKRVKADSPGEVAERLLASADGQRAVLAFPMMLARSPGARIQQLRGLLQRGFRRAWQAGDMIEWSPRQLKTMARDLPAGNLDVVVDRMRLRGEARERLLDSLEIAFKEGQGRATTFVGDDEWHALPFDDRFRCAPCEQGFLRPEPRLFSFNNPYGACSECKGFGSTIELDLDKVVPNKNLSLADGAIEPWTKPSRGRQRTQLKKFCADRSIPMDIPWIDLTAAQRRAVEQGRGGFKGIRGFFERLRQRQHRLRYRVLLARYRGYVPCLACEGSRLRPEAHNVQIGDKTLPEIVQMSIADLDAFFLDLRLPAHQAEIVDRVLEEIQTRLRYLLEVGLDYLTLARLTGTLSGGEAQRISLATCLGSSLVGSMYVLDEPSVGLHPRDNLRLINILCRLRDLGNSVIVVEHDRQMIENADHVVDLGPGAGVLGGQIVFTGSPKLLRRKTDSVTGAYLRGKRRVPIPARRRPARGELIVVGARQHNLKEITVHFPLGLLCCVTGVSGSGKSTLVHDVLYAALQQRLGEAKIAAGDHDFIRGAGLIGSAVMVDQSAIGRSPRSNPVTYIKAFDGIRKAFARTREARNRGYGPGAFSFNVAGGRCDVCAGNGDILVEMQFLPDVRVPCEECRGTRYLREILEIEYNGKNIHEVLQFTVAEARRFFAGASGVSSRLKVLEDVGLGYLRLGQASNTLSGGEAQRVKLAAHLLQGSGAGTLYLFDEPTTGLHFDDIAKLLFALNRLIDAGASVIVIEHNLDLIKAADWVIDLGPEGGDGGGRVVASGTPEQLAVQKQGHTAVYLEPALRRV